VWDDDEPSEDTIEEGFCEEYSETLSKAPLSLAREPLEFRGEFDVQPTSIGGFGRGCSMIAGGRWPPSGTSKEGGLW
jgi:hypothetical protein